MRLRLEGIHGVACRNVQRGVTRTSQARLAIVCGICTVPMWRPLLLNTQIPLGPETKSRLDDLVLSLNFI